MWFWLYKTRIAAIKAAKLNPDDFLGKTPDELLPPEAQWKAHNYNHLHEAPTVFYAIALTLALLGEGDGLPYYLAWAYVALRVVHSLVQATVNRVMLRFQIFAASSIVLFVLIGFAFAAVI
jgi:hypothetical protein